MSNSEENTTSKSKAYELFPFLRAFPFEDYDIYLDKEESTDSFGIDPIVYEASKKYGTEFIVFQYTGNYTKTIISFYTYDIKFAFDNSNKIKKLDSVLKDLDKGLSESIIVNKIDYIKKGERFLKKLGSGLVIGEAFDGVLDELLNVKGVALNKVELKKVKKLSKTLENSVFSDDEREAITAFYNLHLHHIKILLGIVIASKIY